MSEVWNPIDFEFWENVDGEIQITTNEHGGKPPYMRGPIILSVDGVGEGRSDVWLSVEEARVVASKLIEAADAVELAGKREE